MKGGAAVASGALGTLAAAAVLAPWLLPADPLAISDVLSQRLVAPLSQGDGGVFHLLGTDRFGRDLFGRILLAARISLLVGIVGSLLATGIGIVVGAVAGWWRGAADRVLMSMADAMLAVPRLVLLLLCVALWQPGLLTVVIVLAATGWMSGSDARRGHGARVARIRGRPSLGTSRQRILARHVVPNALGPAIVAATLGVGNAILLESGLAFLGLGVQPPTPSWGNMIAGGRDLIVTAPWVALVPGCFLIATVLACTVLGDALRDRLSGQRAVPLSDRA
jgi:peptide/nickel transport system permease protein